jgi:hypothetical protein
MLHVLIGVFFVLHGLVHLLWFVVPWRITTVDGLPYATTILAGRLDVGRAGIRIVGLLWLAATVLWLAAGLALVFAAPWWPRAGGGRGDLLGGAVRAGPAGRQVRSGDQRGNPASAAAQPVVRLAGIAQTATRRVRTWACELRNSRALLWPVS